MGTVLASGIEILNVTTPSVYLAAPVTLLSSLVKITILSFCLCVLVIVYSVYAVTVLVLLAVRFLVALIEGAYIPSKAKKTKAKK